MMTNTVLFGNGLNQVSKRSISWKLLLDQIKGNNKFDSSDLPNTMVYERIFLDRRSSQSEIRIKQDIAEAMKAQETNELYSNLIKLNLGNYLTTNYDYAFEKAISSKPKLNSTEEIYSLRRYRTYATNSTPINLWNIHGEIDHPKSIMLGLDHYCGSISKLDAYIKGTYKTQKDGKLITIQSMKTKLLEQNFCHTTWLDLFFSGNVHIIGLSLDFSETDLWWVINKRARLNQEQQINGRIYFHTESKDTKKLELLKSFNVEIVSYDLKNKNYFQMFKETIQNIGTTIHSK